MSLIIRFEMSEKLPKNLRSRVLKNGADRHIQYSIGIIRGKEVDHHEIIYSASVLYLINNLGFASVLYTINDLSFIDYFMIEFSLPLIIPIIVRDLAFSLPLLLFQLI